MNYQKFLLSFFLIGLSASMFSFSVIGNTYENKVFISKHHLKINHSSELVSNYQPGYLFCYCMEDGEQVRYQYGNTCYGGSTGCESNLCDYEQGLDCAQLD